MLKEEALRDPDQIQCLRKAEAAFETAFPETGRQRWIYFVPGRIEVLGKHTDYAGGRSLLAATTCGLVVVAALNGTDQVRLVNADSQFAAAAFPWSADLEIPIGPWTNYPMSVARRLMRHFGAQWTLQGVDVAVAADLPPASGLSSSSALVVGAFLALAGPNRLAECPLYQATVRHAEDLATYMACLENGSGFRDLTGDRGVGTFGGSEDHTAMLLCQPDRLAVYSFCPTRFHREVPMPESLGFVVCHSGVRAQKTGSALEKYNAVSTRASRACAAYNAFYHTSHGTLSDIVSENAELPGPVLIEKFSRIPKVKDPPDHLLDRFRQFWQESEHFIPLATEALCQGDLVGFGRWVDLSQDGAQRYLWNHVPETDHLQRTARKLGALAASAFGAGFGGSVYALVPLAQVGRFREQWEAAYRARFPEPCWWASWLVTRPSGPARRIAT